MKIGDVVLNITPTALNYGKNYTSLGSFERTINHELVALNVAVVRSWTLQFYALEQGEDLAALHGMESTFEDYDEKTYNIMVTSFSMRGYPEEDCGLCTLTMEEIAPSGWEP